MDRGRFLMRGSCSNAYVLVPGDPRVPFRSNDKVLSCKNVAVTAASRPLLPTARAGPDHEGHS